jgi:hypothetical protein
VEEREIGMVLRPGQGLSPELGEAMSRMAATSLFHIKTVLPTYVPWRAEVELFLDAECDTVRFEPL